MGGHYQLANQPVDWKGWHVVAVNPWIPPNQKNTGRQSPPVRETQEENVKVGMVVVDALVKDNRVEDFRVVEEIKLEDIVVVCCVPIFLDI